MGRVRSSAIAVVVGVLLLGGVVAAPSTAPVAAAEATKLTLVVDDCTGCRLTLVNPPTESSDSWSSVSKDVSSGRVTFTIPTERTRKMAIELHSPKDTNGLWVPLVVMRYKGRAVGASVTADQAAQGKQAYPFWAGGKSGGSATLRIKVSTFRYDDPSRGPVTAMRPYLATGVATSGRAWRTTHGALGYQGFA